MLIKNKIIKEGVKTKKLRKSKGFKLIKLIYLLIILIFLFLFPKYKPIAIIIIFEIFDFFKYMIKRSFPLFPIDFEFVFGMLLAYFFSPFYSIIIVLLNIINRALYFNLDMGDILKIPRHVLMFYAMYFFKSYWIGLSFFEAGMRLLVSNYILKYTISITYGTDSTFNSFPFHVVNMISSTTMFYLISVLNFYMPYLLSS